MTEFEKKREAYRKLAEDAVGKYMPERDEPQASVLEAMRYSVGAGGKRVRPTLLLAFCEGCCGDVARALPFAAAIEYIHSYSLIHDDLPCMDDDDLRRGKPSCHIRFGEATALLAGDGLLNLAFETVLDACDGRGAVEAARTLAAAAGVDGMIGGQELDMQGEERSLTADELLEMYALKTGALLSASCKIGVQLAGGTRQQAEHAAQYGRKLGVAFQIVDDLLDIYGDTATLGKPVGSDRAKSKPTYASLRPRSDAEGYAARLTDECAALLEGFGFRDTFLLDMTAFLLTRKS